MRGLKRTTLTQRLLDGLLRSPEPSIQYKTLTLVLVLG